MTLPAPDLHARLLDLLTPATRAAADDGALARYGEGPGPAGDTRPHFLTRDAWARNQIDLAVALDALLTPDDVVMVAVPYELSFTGALVERAAELLGATVLSVGTSNTICPVPRALGLIRRYGVTALVCSPAVATELAAVDVTLGERPADSTVRRIVCVGEGVPPGGLDRIGTLWGASATAVLGTAAVPVVAVPCAHGALHLCADRLRATVRPTGPDPARGELLLAPAGPDGAGTAEATGERVELRPGPDCPCGDRGPVLVPLGPVAGPVGGGAPG